MWHTTHFIKPFYKTDDLWKLRHQHEYRTGNKCCCHLLNYYYCVSEAFMYHVSNLHTSITVVVYLFYRWEKIGTEKIIFPKSYLVVRDTFPIYHASFFCGFLGLSTCLYSSVFSFLIHASPFIRVCHNSRERIKKKKITVSNEDL